MFKTLTIIQKSVILFCIGSTTAFVGYQLLKPSALKSENVLQIRKKLLEGGRVRMLYSSLSFMYLHKFQQGSTESLFELRQILKLGVPNLVALPLSEEEYNKKYVKVLNHPKFSQAIKKFDFLLEQGDPQALRQMEDLELNHIEKLYLIDLCKRKRCKILFGLRPPQEYERLRQLKIEGVRNVQEVRAEDMVNKLIGELKEKTSFSFVPKNPYTTVLCLSEPTAAQPIAKLWKDKFSSAHGHKIFEDDLLQRQADTRDAKTKPYNKQIVR